MRRICSADALSKSRQVFGREFPDFFAKIKSKREKIIERGRIRSEDEYYLIRDYVDELEGDVEPSDLLITLYGLVDDYGVD